MPTYTVEWDQAGDGTFSTDISGYVMDVHTDRGRKTDLETMPPGYATLILNNADGRFSPDYASGAYYPDVEIYRRVRIKVAHLGTDYGLFWGWILGWDNKPKTTEQTVTWFLGDRFAILQDRLLKLRLSRNIPVVTALHKLLDTIEGVNVTDNPSVEEDLTGYAALQGITPVRDSTMPFDGDYVIREDCPGAASGEGWQYDVTSMIPADEWYQVSVFARVSEGTASITFKARDNLGSRATRTLTLGTTWTRFSPSSGFKYHADSTSRYLELYTNGTIEIVFYSDLLLAWPVDSASGFLIRSFGAGTAEIELLAAYRQSSLDVLYAIAESEPRVFLSTFYYIAAGYHLEYIRFRDKDYRDTAIAAGPDATFSDDGSDTPYHDLILGEDAIDRISEVEVVSQGDYLDENEEVTVWELSPINQPVAPTETFKIRARYSQPARDCSLVINPPPTAFEIGADGADGEIQRADDAPYPPATQTIMATLMRVGQRYDATWDDYFIWHSFLMWDTSDIPDAATITSAKLRVWLKIDMSATNFTIRARASTWTLPLSDADWDGTGAIKGTFATAGLPRAGYSFDIELDVDTINKTGWTKLELTSSREGTAPTGDEYVHLYDYSDGVDRLATLIIEYGGSGFATEVFRNYGVGADIELTAGSEELVIEGVEVKGKPLKGTSEESKVIAAAPSPPPVDRTLSIALPLQGTRTPSMETEATRLAARYDGRIRRPALVLRPVTDAVLTQMLVREIGDLIHVENIGSAYGTWIDGNYWIEGIEHSFEEDGSSHETTFYLEEV